MSLRILYDNLWRAGEIVAKSNEQAQFPAVDTQADTKLMFWRTPTMSVANETIDNDFASNKSINSIVLWNHDFSNTANISIIGADDANFANNATTLSVPYNAGNIVSFNSTTTRRYWRLRIQDANSAPGYLQCGPVFLGPYWEPSRYFNSEYEEGAEDMSGIEFSDSGIIIADEKSMPEVRRYTFEGLTDADQIEAKALIKSCGMHVPFIICTDANYPNTYSYFVRLAEISQPKKKHTNCWAWEMAVREAF